MLLASIPKPPAHDPTQWNVQLDRPRPPRSYNGTRFGFATVERLIEPLDDGRLYIMGAEVPVINLQLESPTGDPNYPIYFETTGQQHHYVVSIWSDRIEIEVCANDDTYMSLSTMFPETEEQLVTALHTIVNDCSRR